MATLDITQQIKIDHDNVRDLWSRFQSARTQEEKASIGNTLIREIVIHGDAEETSVYNDYARLGVPGSADHNKEEHAQIKALIYQAEAASASQPNYAEVLGKAVNVFITHATEEETKQHPTIKAKLSAEESDKIARAFLKARSLAPSRDKVVEKVSGRQLVQVKFKHPETY